MALADTDATQSSFAPHNGSHSQTEGAPAPPWHRADPPCQRPRNSDSREGCFSSLCPTAFGRPRWDRATARNCGRRIAGCDAHPAESEEVSALVLCEQHSCILSQNGPRWPQESSFHGGTAWLKKIVFATTASRRSRKRRAPAAGLTWEKTKRNSRWLWGPGGPEWPLHRGPGAGPGRLRHHVFSAGPQMNAKVALRSSYPARLPSGLTAPHPVLCHAGDVHPQGQDGYQGLTCHRRCHPIRPLRLQQYLLGQAAGTEGTVPQPLLPDGHGL